MHTSYKRYWEPSTPQVLLSSTVIGLIGQAATYPFEFIKTRIQIKAEGVGIRQYSINAGYNPNKIFRQIHANGQGMSQFYTGLGASLTSRFQYLFTRNLIYKYFYDKYKPVKPTNDLNYREKAMIAGTAGYIAAFVSNPFELIMTRQIYDTALPVAQRRGYQGVFQAYSQIMAQEGLNGIFKGAHVHALKHLVLNSILTGPYDYMNEKMWICFGDTDYNKPVALIYASVIASLVTLPLDNIKTRLQKQFPDPRMNRITYYGLFDACEKIFKIETPQSLLVGFYAYFAKVTVYGFMTVYTYDYLTTYWKKQAGLKEIHM